MSHSPDPDVSSGIARIELALGSARASAPFVDATDMQLVEVGVGRVGIRVHRHPWIDSPFGGLMSLAACAADSALVYAVMSAVAGDSTASTIRLGIHLLGGAPSESVTASARVIEIIGDKGVSTADLIDGAGRSLGHATARSQVVPRAVGREHRQPQPRGAHGPARRLTRQHAAVPEAEHRYVLGETHDFSNAVGVMHGGAIATLLIESAAMTTHEVSPIGAAARAVDLDVTFVRPVPLDGGTWLSCAPVQVGKRSTTVDSVLWSGGRPCAYGRVGFVEQQG